MNYLQNRKSHKSSSVLARFGLSLFFLILFSPWLRESLMPLSVPFWQLSNALEDSFLNIVPFLRAQKSLVAENESLRKRLEEAESEVLVKKSLLAQNIELKSLLGRENELSKTFLAAVLTRPARMLYDELLIEIGKKEGVNKGDMVLGKGDVAYGKVEEVYEKVSKVRLYSFPGDETEVQIGDGGLVGMLKGRGGGNFYLELPREVELAEEELALLPGSKVRVLAEVRKIEKDEKSSIQRVYLKSPINVFNIKWVRVLPSISS